MKIIKSKIELENAIKYKENNFIIQGELAKELNKTQKFRNLSKWSLGILATAIGAIALAPATGGVSAISGGIAAATVATLTGLEIVAIIAIAFFGISLLTAIYKDYDIKFKGDLNSNNFEAEFSRKR